MAELQLGELARRMNGTLVQGDPHRPFKAFAIDSRLTAPGALFFAIRGERDGHEFVAAARTQGAAGAVITRTEGLPPLSPDFGLILVPDTTQALQDLAAGLVRDFNPRVVAITGSAGKTTTKEFTAALLGHKFRVLKSEGNFNNHLGLALSLLKLERHHQVAVLEMAMSGAGEIARLTRIAPPDIAVITNINPVHLEFFDSLDAIALAKKEILDGAKKSAQAVLNADDPRVMRIGRSFPGDKVLFGFSEACTLRASGIDFQGFDGMAFDLAYGSRKIRLRIPFFTENYVQNFLAAAGVAYGMSLGLEEVTARAAELKPVPRRGILYRLKKDIVLVDDSYNSNPRAVEAALRGLARLPAGRRVAVLGDMLELGSRAPEFHSQAGKDVVAAGWHWLVAIGPLSRRTAEAALQAGLEPGRCLCLADADEACRRVPDLIEPGDLVLVKGSRGMRTDRVTDRILEVYRET